MKIIRLILGIISIALYGVIISWLYIAGNTDVNNEEINSSVNTVLAFLFFIAGIAGIIGRESKSVSIIIGGFYALGGIIGAANAGSFADLKIWSVLSFIFAAFFVVSGIIQKNRYKKTKIKNL